MQHGKAVSNLLEVADLHQSWPKLNGSPDDRNRIVYDAKADCAGRNPVQSHRMPFEAGRDQSQRIDAILTFSRLCGMECKPTKAGDLLQNFFCILCGDVSHIAEGDGQLDIGVL
jgi:hypothetical protein